MPNSQYFTLNIKWSNICANQVKKKKKDEIEVDAVCIFAFNPNIYHDMSNSELNTLKNPR